MVQLGAPHVRFHRSFLAAADEFRAAGEWRHDGIVNWPAEGDFAGGWLEDPERPDEFMGSISLRHNIDHPMLATVGGHVGYGVRPSARRRGFASDALRQVVPLAAAHGIPRLLVTCDLDNVASARTIEANGGEFEGELRGKRRYWIDT